VTDSTLLADDELLALWEHGRRIALASCSGTLRALRCGRGGFYEAEDLWQDLFLDFWALVSRWQQAPPPRRTDELWAAWRRHLWQGGRRVLRRRPQRLWRTREVAIDPSLLELDNDPGDGREPSRALPANARQALTEPPVPEEACYTRAVVEAADRRLWALSATDRQALYLTSIVGLSRNQAARCLGLANEASVQNRAHRARLALRAASEATGER